MPAAARLPLASAAAPLARDPDPAGLTEVLLIGSAGAWSRGRTLDAAYADANARAPLGARICIVVAPVCVAAYVDDTGALRWNGDHGRALRPHHVAGPDRAAAAAGSSVSGRVFAAALQFGGASWPARRTDAMRAAVDALTADVAAVVADYVALPAE